MKTEHFTLMLFQFIEFINVDLPFYTYTYWNSSVDTVIIFYQWCPQNFINVDPDPVPIQDNKITKLIQSIF